MLLENRIVIITGIGPGLGRDVALLFAREGADLVIAARNAERLEAVAEEARSIGRDVLAIPTDLTDRAGCQRLVASALEHFGRVDALVQNGHYDGDYKIVTESDPQDWRDIMEVNLFGATA
jgi:NAD(P)-dependent dehydrogenase (short-subunit alcohol dehydrogenase family)